MRSTPHSPSQQATAPQRFTCVAPPPHLKCALIMWMGCANALGQWYRPCGPPLPRGSTPISTMWVSGSRSFSVCSVCSTLRSECVQRKGKHAGQERPRIAGAGQQGGWRASQSSKSCTAHWFPQMGGVTPLNALAETLPITHPACPPEGHPRHRLDQQLLGFPQVGGICRSRAQVCRHTARVRRHQWGDASKAGLAGRRHKLAAASHKHQQGSRAPRIVPTRPANPCAPQAGQLTIGANEQHHHLGLQAGRRCAWGRWVHTWHGAPQDAFQERSQSTRYCISRSWLLGSLSAAMAGEPGTCPSGQL